MSRRKEELVQPFYQSNFLNPMLTSVRRFRIGWLSKAHISFKQFLHVRVKDNFEGPNERSRVTSCRDGTELPRYSGIRNVANFLKLSIALLPPLHAQSGSFEDRWTLLMNPQISLAIDLNFYCSIPLESKYGSYAK